MSRANLALRSSCPNVYFFRMKLSSQMQDKSVEKDWVHVEQPSSQADSMTVLVNIY